VDTDMLNIRSFSYSGQGQVAISNQQLTYLPAMGFSGEESIVYLASDGLLVDQAIVTVKVNSVTPMASDSGGGGMLLLSLLSFLCFSVRLCKSSILKYNYE
jgi:hypothetical protein